MTRKIRKRRRNWVGRILLAGTVLALFAVTWRFIRKSNEHIVPPNAYYEVKRADLLISVVEEGALKAMNEVAIRNNLAGDSRIIQLAPEGSHVKKGELLVELDSSLLKDNLNEQELTYQDNVFLLVQAQENLKIQQSLIESRIKSAELQIELAETDLAKYRDGDAPKQTRTGNAQLALIEDAVRIATERYARTQELHKNGDATKSELEGDSLSLTRNKLALEQTKEDLRLLKKFDQPNTIRMLESNVQQSKDELEQLKHRSAAEMAQAEAELKTSGKALQLMDTELKRQKKQLENAKIYAPQDGLVVYASASPFLGRGEGRPDEGRSRMRDSGYGSLFESDGRFRRGGGGGEGRRGGGEGRRGGGGGGSGSSSGSGSGGGSSYSSGGSGGGGGGGGSSLSGGGGGGASASTGQGSSGTSGSLGSSSISGGSSASSGLGGQTSSGGGGASSGSGRQGSSSFSSGGQSSGSEGAPTISYTSVRQNSSLTGSKSFGQSSSSGSGGSSSSGGSSYGSGGQSSSYSTEGSQFGSRSGSRNYSSFDEGSFFMFGGTTVIEEGATVRQRQELIKLPDVSRMVVEVKVQESRVRQVVPGMLAFVKVETLPGRRFKGTVRKVGILPDTQSSWMNPNNKVYATDVLIDDEMPELKPGVSARAEIIITNLPNVLSVPIQAVATFRGEHVCFTQKGSSVIPVPVTTGWFNDRFIEIKSGLREGDHVLLAPPVDEEHIEIESPEAATNQVESAENDPTRPRNASTRGSEGQPQAASPSGPTLKVPPSDETPGAQRGDSQPQAGRGSPTEGGRRGRRGDDPESQRRREEFMKLSPEEREARSREFQGRRGEGRGRQQTPDPGTLPPSENAKP